MNIVVVTVLILILMLLSIFLKMWIGTAMSVFGLIGIAIISSAKNAFLEAGLEPFAQVSAYTFTCVPLFVLMGGVISNTGLGSDLFDFAAKAIGHIRGGLAMASIVACGIFAAVSGSSMATAVTMGRLAYPEMKRYNYNTSLAAGALACGGTIGFMIPPSITFIIYGLLTQNSIGSLFMAGLLPGIVNIIVYVLVIKIACTKNPRLGPAGPRYTNRERLYAAKGTWPIIVLLFIVLGGIYLGICTSTEAGALGAGGAIIIAFILKKLNWPNLKTSVFQAVSTTGMFVVMMVGSFIFMRFITLSGIPSLIRDNVANLTISKYWIVIAVIIFYLITGAIFDAFSAVTLTIAISYPLMLGLGYDPIWFGVMITKLIMIGQYTPPIGMTVFVSAGALNVPAGEIFRGVWPFLISDFAQLALLVIFPAYPLLLVR